MGGGEGLKLLLVSNVGIPHHITVIFKYFTFDRGIRFHTISTADLGYLK